MSDFSVCILDYHRYLDRCLRSVLAQTAKPRGIYVLTADQPLSQFDDDVHWMVRPQFERGTGRNLLVNQTETPLVILTQSDIEFPPGLFEEALIHFGPAPYRSLLVGSWSKYQVEENSPKFRPYLASHSYICGAFQVCRREDYLKVGGYNELMTGWGWEDVDFEKRICGAGAIKQILKTEYLHIWHPKQINYKSEARNRLLTKTSRWDGQRWVMCGESREK